MTTFKQELDSLKKWQYIIYFILLFGGGVMAWTNVAAQTVTNAKKIAELTLEQKALKDGLSKIQTTVVRIKVNQENAREDIQEIKSDLKLLLRRVR